MRKIIAILLACIFLAGCTIYVYEPQDEIFDPGSYTITVAGYNGDITVKTTFDQSRVTEIEVLRHEETPGLAYVALQQIADAIILSQSFEVDVVTGATYTCYAMLEAVSRAAKMAGANVEIITLPEGLAPDTVTGATEEPETVTGASS